MLIQILAEEIKLGDVYNGKGVIGIDPPLHPGWTLLVTWTDGTMTAFNSGAKLLVYRENNQIEERIK